MGKLYIVPTPIGNLEDITLRAIRILKEVDIILAEDTRKTKILLNHLQISKTVYSHHKFNEHKSTEALIRDLQGTQTFALVSDAGTPAISDPGFFLVRECVKNDIEIECLPGATAFVPALVTSGLPCDKFVFEGFLPQKKGRQKRLTELSTEERTIVFYESPHRIIKTLTQIKEFFNDDREVCVSRELTKIHEENIRGTISEVIEYYSNKTIKGEIVLIVAGLKPENNKHKKYNDEE